MSSISFILQIQMWSQTSKTELYAKIVIGWKTLTILTKSSTLDIWLVSKYAIEMETSEQASSYFLHETHSFRKTVSKEIGQNKCKNYWIRNSKNAKLEKQLKVLKQAGLNDKRIASLQYKLTEKNFKKILIM